MSRFYILLISQALYLEPTGLLDIPACTNQIILETGSTSLTYRLYTQLRGSIVLYRSVPCGIFPFNL